MCAISVKTVALGVKHLMAFRRIDLGMAFNYVEWAWRINNVSPPKIYSEDYPDSDKISLISYMPVCLLGFEWDLIESLKNKTHTVLFYLFDD